MYHFNLMEESTLSYQEGGNHYLNMGLQPWEIIDKNQLNFYEGNALKYLLRHRLKETGKGDLEKAIHYINHIIEIEYGHQDIDSQPEASYPPNTTSTGVAR